MNISNMLCDLYDIKNMAKLNGFGNLPKDNEGTELTINDCIDSCIEELEQELKEWLLQKLEKTNLNYLFKNLGGYSMDSKTRNKILERCEILRYMGDDGVSCIFDRLDDDDLMEECGWVLDHDDLDNYQYMGIVKGVVRRNSWTLIKLPVESGLTL